MSLSRLKMQQDVRTLKETSYVAMIALSSPSLVKLGLRIPQKRSFKVPHPIKFNGILRWLRLIPYYIVQYARGHITIFIYTVSQKN